ncbi:hypothetical protein K443DRAFT_113821, partial [Laccaria amethystina LaAM-08-1]
PWPKTDVYTQTRAQTEILDMVYNYAYNHIACLQAQTPLLNLYFRIDFLIYKICHIILGWYILTS